MVATLHDGDRGRRRRIPLQALRTALASPLNDEQSDEEQTSSLARWRHKDRIKTQAAALILCLNIGVDPPDAVKVSPCARMECWLQPDPSHSARNSQGIARALQQQYERWQPRARYKTHADPTVDDVKRLCREARRAARVCFRKLS
jgi:regulatory associated protein of mTOR